MATGWIVRGSNSGGGEIFRNRPDRPWGPPSHLYNGYRVVPEGNPPGAAASPKRLTRVAYLQLATEPFWARNPDSQPTKVYPSHNQFSAT
jgi:hypothetical protein